MFPSVQTKYWLRELIRRHVLSYKPHLTFVPAKTQHFLRSLINGFVWGYDFIYLVVYTSERRRSALMESSVVDWAQSTNEVSNEVQSWKKGRNKEKGLGRRDWDPSICSIRAQRANHWATDAWFCCNETEVWDSCASCRRDCESRSVALVRFILIALIRKGVVDRKACESLSGVRMRLYVKYEGDACRGVIVMCGHKYRRTLPCI